jgi:hypothetical protein
MKQIQEANRYNQEIIKDSPYRNIIGSLMYAMVATRPDLAVAVSVLSKYVERPQKVHIELLKHLLKYVKTNLNYSLEFTGKKQDNISLVGYVDASYASDPDYKSLSGYGFLVNNCLVSWHCGKQSIVAQSTAEAEYYAAVSGANECIWLKQLLLDLGYEQQNVTLFEDNEACIILSRNPEDHKRTKHIQVKYHVLRQYVTNEVLHLKYCSTKSQLADCFTKILHGPTFRDHMQRLGLLKLSFQEES